MIKLLNSRLAIINSCNSTLSRSKSYQTRRYPPRRPASKPPQRPPSRLLNRKPVPFIDDLKQIHGPEDLLSLFNDYQKMGVKHDYPSYSSLIYKLAKSRNFEAVDTLLGCLKSYNIHCRESLFIGLIQHYGKCGLVEKATHLFREMRESFNCFRSIQSFNTLLNELVENGRDGEAYGMFKGCWDLGFRPNSVSFNIMMKMYLQKGEFESAREVFDEMLERDVEPTVVSYNSQIGFLCKRGEFEKGKSLFEGMVKKGTKPNEVTYALLMEGLCFSGRYKDAKKLMFDMEYRGCKPRVVNYGVLMSDLGKRGKIEEAKSLIIEMKKRHLKPDAAIYNVLISYFCREDRAAEAYRVLVEMQIAGCKPNATTYRTVVDGFCKTGEFEEGLKIFNAMSMSGHFPRTETLRSLVIGLFDRGKVDDSYFVLEEMAKRKKMFDFESWEAIVKDSCAQDKAFDNLCLGRVLEEEPVSPAVEPETPEEGPVSMPVSGATASGASPAGAGVAGATATASGSGGAGGEGPDDHTFSFFMHDILGGSNPSAIAVTGIVTNPAVSGQVPFAKPNGAVLAVNNGVNVNNANSGIISNNNIPFLTGLSGITGNAIQNNGNGNNNYIIGGGFGFPALNMAQLGSGITFQKLMFGTLTVFDDELTEGHELNSGLVGKAQGFYIASSEDGTSQTMAFTVMFRSGSYADSLTFFGVHRIHVSESHLAIMGGTGKYVNAKGFATVKTIPASPNQQETDGVETVLHITVYLAY